MLNARNLHLSLNNRVILDDVAISLLAKDRVALVGENGVGKSSLLRILYNDTPDAGAVEKVKHARIGFLQQTPDLDDDLTVLETVRLGIERHLELIAEHERLCLELAHAHEGDEKNKLAKKIDEKAQIIDGSFGFDVDYWIERVLSRLGISARQQKVGLLSGGERRRVDLARILLSAPDIYLLDEPTNHLDISAIEFLIDTFKKSNAAVLFVSHDAKFIDEFATKIAELSAGKIYWHTPPFANYLENKLVRDLIDERTLHRRERLVAGELAWLRAGTPARTTKQNARIDRAHELIDQVARDNEAQRKKALDLEITKSKRLGSTILELDHVGMQFGERVLFKDLSLKVTEGQRYGILGLNGSGKTTLLSLLSKQLQPTFGAIAFGKNTDVIRFDQQREQLDQKATLKETLADHGDFVTVSGRNIHIASYLEKYLFRGDDANRRVSTLSGGEQNRLLLAKLFRQDANCLLLDEPTNDLDVTSILVLEEVLLRYPGVIFVVSHDRNFLDRICTYIIAFEKNSSPEQGESKVVVYPGNFTDYMHLKARDNSEGVDEDVPVEKKAKAERVRVKKKRSFKEEREFQEMESTIQALEMEQQELNSALADGTLFVKDPKIAQQKLARLHALETEISQLYDRWQVLTDIEG